MQFACLFITHDLAVIDVLATRIALMHRGELVEVGTRDEILRNPQLAYTQRPLARRRTVARSRGATRATRASTRAAQGPTS